MAPEPTPTADSSVPSTPPPLTDKDFFVQFDADLRNTIIDAMERFKGVPVNHDRSMAYTRLREAFFYVSADLSNLTSPAPDPKPENPEALPVSATIVP